MVRDFDEKMMRRALLEAERAAQNNDVPVGAIITSPDGEVLAVAHNEKELDQDPTAHAEMIAIKKAAKKIGSWRLLGTSIFVTKEPCPMCAGAIYQARIDRLVFGASDEKAGAAGTLYNIVNDERLNHQVKVVSGILEEECREQLQRFFQERR